MVSVASLLNPVPSEQLPSPCSTLCSPEPFSPYLPVKKQKLCKDEAVFIKGKPKGDIQYWPCEDENEDIAAEHKKYEIFPKGHIADYCKHIPYNSEKKSFLLKMGREGFQGQKYTVIDESNYPETDPPIVFQYTFKMPHTEKKHVVMWDYNIGLVRITPFFKALDHPKVRCILSIINLRLTSDRRLRQRCLGRIQVSKESAIVSQAEHWLHKVRRADCSVIGR